MADLEIFEMALETGAHVHIAHSSLARGFEIAEVFRAWAARPRARPASSISA
jgi:allantoinase